MEAISVTEWFWSQTSSSRQYLRLNTKDIPLFIFMSTDNNELREFLTPFQICLLSAQRRSAVVLAVFCQLSEMLGKFLETLCFLDVFDFLEDP